MKNAYLIGIGASICIGREIWCLPYAGFFMMIVVDKCTHLVRTATAGLQSQGLFYKLCCK